MTGAVVSIVSANEPAALVLPAASVAVAVTEYVPSARAEAMGIEYEPPVAVPVPTRLPAMKRLTDEPGSAVPTSRGDLTFVMPSPVVPESSAASRPSAGAAGAVASIVRANGALVALVLPAASVAVAVTEYVPSARRRGGRIVVAPPVAVAVPTTEPATRRRTVDPASAVPVSRGLI